MKSGCFVSKIFSDFTSFHFCKVLVYLKPFITSQLDDKFAVEFYQLILLYIVFSLFKSHTRSNAFIRKSIFKIIFQLIQNKK